MHKITIHANQGDYPVFIKHGLRHEMKELLTEYEFSQVLIITDSNVSGLYLKDVEVALKDKFNVFSYVLPAGENSKSMKQYELILNYMLNQNFDRNSAVIALGGGVAGDLAGFVASTYMRGIAFIQAPTTLQAHDSSVGGKVAINLNGTKNIVGQFYPPKMVIYDTETLLTLSKNELKSGFAEMIKHGFIADRTLLEGLIKTFPKQIDPNHASFNHLLLESIRIKQQVVESDELEKGHRKVLNFGHTLGHAVEAQQLGYTHGECVAYGMLFALYLSDLELNYHTLLTSDLVEWFNRLGFPINLSSSLNVDKVIQTIKYDKKNSNGRINFILIEETGKPYTKSYTPVEIKHYLHTFLTLDLLKGGYIENNNG
ncbi:3-dehydroquinate synthase [Aquisalibacillus elongatus]|uniref:3-dehydroquinate synthase n=1 Tax=Aquisalibacillus elongatus TaxID=485577 RepID=A0A3N5CET4_9BACI|nr:3-dehydroquinate synthase [Aquisalibacillus elongatus]RPF55771.1 3-dehydroquinate synthase [Aquisalibacillus elongatus]